MNLPTLVQAAKGTATFLRYEGYPEPRLMYRLAYYDEDAVDIQYLDFPIPVADSAAGSFEPTMPGINVLRWVRKHCELMSGAPPAPRPARPDGGMMSK